MNRPPILDEILKALALLRNNYRDERRLHDDTLDLLVSYGFAVTREHRLTPRDRIDLVVHASPDYVGIEIKTRGSETPIMRQIYRYGDCLPIVVLLTTTPIAASSGPLENSRGQTFWLEIIKLNLRNV